MSIVSDQSANSHEAGKLHTFEQFVPGRIELRAGGAGEGVVAQSDC